MKLLVTGGCGFIGSNFVRLVLRARKAARVVNLDALTYAGNPENLRDVESDPRYEFVHASIVDEDRVDALVRRGFDAIVNFAAESHVDRSLHGPQEFVRANVQGTVTLLEASKRHGVGRFLQVSTDEVYGSLPAEGAFTESTPLHPNNPYASTKAAADLMVQSYVHTFGVDALITRSSNNYGPFQYPEKFIPLFISNAIEGRPCPLYGDGMQVRDWLHVQDNGRGILAALEKGRSGEVYNLGGGNERPNLVTARSILKRLRKPESLIQFVKDRPGHDRRYAIDCRKARRELGWAPKVSFEKGLRETVDWYLGHGEWVARVRSGEYRKYYEKHYGAPLPGADAPRAESTPIRRRR
ncbi:MAG TPA: dTDP-glucose 4,6-dehydratase [Planctomycetota bacterium]|nr:dTDP-glucose 4,6-dehydratase [Planctomycetota bacterium]